MAKENQVIINVGVDGAKTVQDLRNNIKALKDELAQYEIGTEEYQKTLKELNVNQAALKNAMYATSASMEDVAQAAKAQNVQFDEQNKLVKNETISYNELVKKMADLKTEYRAATDEFKRNNLGAQIKSVNERLKELDAMQGNFQRNVGDYANQVGKGLKEVLGDLPKSLDAIREPMDGIAKTTSLLGKQPIFGILALVAPILTKIVTELKENDTAVASLKKGLDALKPIADVFMSIVQKVADWLGVIIDKLVQYAPAVMNILKNIVTGATGVGNAILQFIIAPVRATIEAFKGLGTVIKDVFSGQFKQAAADAKTAIKGINDIFDNGISFAANFAAGKKAADKFLEGLSNPRVTKKAEETGQKIGESVTKGVEDSWQKWFDTLEAKANAVLEQRRKMREQIAQEAEADTQALADEINAEWEAQFKAEEEARQKNEQRREQFRAGMEQAAASTSSIMSSLADMIESGTNVTEKEARRAKNLRIASATIDMLQGATTAYSTAQSLGVPMGPIVGAINAAAVVAMGMANIAKIKSQNVSANASATGSTTPVVGTPSIAPQVQQVRTITSASEEDRLNQMASEQKVYLVTSELEAKQNDTRVRLAEATF